MILIIDNGSQYTHLIKRNTRDLGLDSIIINSKKALNEIEAELIEAKKIILSGGPGSVYLDSPNLSFQICQSVKENKIKVPLLGICYGHQMIGHVFGGTVSKGKSAEYGMSKVIIDEKDEIFRGVETEFTAWVSHFDEVKKLPLGFVSLAHSEICEVEAMKNQSRKIYGVQFHPEVWHTQFGEKILENFLKL